MKPVIVIHGGAGAISRSAMTSEKEREYHQALADILRSGQKILEQGGSAVEAVTAAVVGLEDCPLFNAGRGAVFTSDATHELDAAIMDGLTLRTGAIANVHRIRNPILAARQVMLASRHVFFVGEGAERFAAAQGLELVDPSYFSTPSRLEQLERVRRENPDAAVLDHDGQSKVENQPAAEIHPLDMDKKFGTVGAVALDQHGNLAAATSTGGITNKQVGRVGDAPVIGAGTYASNQTCAVSATGTGEMYIRKVAAYDIAARMRYAGQTLEQACNAVMFEELPSIGGKGGLIAVDAQGHFVMPFNTEGMYRGYAHPGQAPVTEIYRS
ncbi:MAG TPA: beta-aspartyl-peptidase [Alcaligenaceae bacterium]|nr:beta-aspartyl-peptidase [Alcaligenaceae bacterium]